MRHASSSLQRDCNPVRIFDNPTRKQLNHLQQALAKDRDVGLVDIWAIIDPLFLVAEQDGELMGVASINRTGSLPELHKLYVLPSHRHKGVGNALLQHAVRRLRCEGAVELMVETIEGSEDYWDRQAAAYRVNRYGYNRFGIVLGAADDSQSTRVDIRQPDRTGEPTVS